MRETDNYFTHDYEWNLFDLEEIKTRTRWIKNNINELKMDIGDVNNHEYIVISASADLVPIDEQSKDVFNFSDIKEDLKDISCFDERLGNAINCENIITIFPKRKAYHPITKEGLIDSLYGLKKYCLDNNINRLFTTSFVPYGHIMYKYKSYQRCIAQVFCDTDVKFLICLGEKTDDKN